jgi:excinuclease ABC subunit B
MEYNKKHGIVPTTVKKGIRELIEATKEVDKKEDFLPDKDLAKMTKKELKAYVEKLEKEMREAARNLEFEKAAQLRDIILEIKAQAFSVVREGSDIHVKG